jgi:hypothetical protein
MLVKSLDKAQILWDFQETAAVSITCTPPVPAACTCWEWYCIAHLLRPGQAVLRSHCSEYTCAYASWAGVQFAHNLLLDDSTGPVHAGFLCFGQIAV